MSPQTLLHMLLEQVEDIDRVIAIIKHKDGAYTIQWSPGVLSETAMAAALLQANVTATICEEMGEG